METWDQFSLQTGSNPLSNHTRLAQLVQICVRQLQQFTQHPLCVMPQEWRWPLYLAERETGTGRCTEELPGAGQRVRHGDKGTAFDKVGIREDLCWRVHGRPRQTDLLGFAHDLL